MGQQVCVCGGSVLSPGSKRLDVQLGNGSTGVCVCVHACVMMSLFCPHMTRDMDVQLGNV